MAEQAFNKVRLRRMKPMVKPICFGTTSLSNLPDTYSYRVDPQSARVLFGVSGYCKVVRSA